MISDRYLIIQPIQPVIILSFTVVGEVENGNNPQANGGAGDSKKTKELQDVYNDLSPETRTYCNSLRSNKKRRTKLLSIK
ncbi:unnamed protein product [Rhizophagus irregularis]|nr:unnamed protein product [Rhizophagus irregularis]